MWIGPAGSALSSNGCTLARMLPFHHLTSPARDYWPLDRTGFEYHRSHILAATDNLWDSIARAVTTPQVTLWGSCVPWAWYYVLGNKKAR